MVEGLDCVGEGLGCVGKGWSELRFRLWSGVVVGV